MTRHTHEQIETWADQALEAHQNGDRYTLIRPKHIVDLLLEIRAHRALADEATWDEDTPEHTDTYNPAGGPLCSHHQALADHTHEHPDTIYDPAGLILMPQDDGMIWETGTGLTIQWEGDVGMWHLRQPGESTGGRWRTESIPDQLSDDDYPIYLQGEPTPDPPKPYQFNKSSLLYTLREAEAKGIRNDAPDSLVIDDNDGITRYTTTNLDRLVEALNKTIRGGI